MEKAIKTREKLLDAAIDLFAANGFGGTSIREIARHIGMTIPNIYYHFGNKEGLLTAILERAMRQIVDGLGQVIARRDLDPIDRFKLLLKTHFDLLIIVGRKEASILFLEEENISRFRKPFQVDLMNMYRAELRNLQALGYVNQKNLTVLAFNIFGVINWHLRWYKPDGKMTLDEIKEEMISFVLCGISGVPRPELSGKGVSKERGSS